VFGDNFKNFFFIQAGILDAGIFEGVEEIEKLKEHVRHELNRYVVFMRSQGFYVKGFSAFGTDIVDEICSTSDKIIKLYPQAAFFGGQMVFARETSVNRVLHNYTTFAVQRKLYQRGIPFVIMQIRID
jgi:hypothetical protein